MCFTAIPGSNGQIRGAQFVSMQASVHKKKMGAKPKVEKIPLAKLLSRRPIETIPVFSGEHSPMSPGWVLEEICRRDQRRLPGKWNRKRQHKPCWRTNYIEHFESN